MLIKSADDKQRQVAALEALLGRPDVDGQARQRVEQELRQVRAGISGERQAAYEIDFYFAGSPNWMVIHDLRLEVDGRVAQIDHLLIGRLFDAWVLESKHFAQGVGVNEHGEWTAWYGKSSRGIASPIEQNRRHIEVLDDAFRKRLVWAPTRLGLPIRPTVKSLVLISNDARISRPKGKAASRVDGLDTVIKAEQLRRTMEREVDQMSAVAIMSSVRKIVKPETIKRVARELAALHRPIEFDWAARFGLPPAPPVQPSAYTSAAPPLTAPVPSPRAFDPERASASATTAGQGVARTPPPVPGSRSAATCAECGRPVSRAVVDYCVAHAERFAGHILCYDCQRRPRGAATA